MKINISFSPGFSGSVAQQRQFLDLQEAMRKVKAMLKGQFIQNQEYHNFYHISLVVSTVTIQMVLDFYAQNR